MVELSHNIAEATLAFVDGLVDVRHGPLKLTPQSVHVAIEVSCADLGANLRIELDLFLVRNHATFNDSLHFVYCALWATFAVLDLTELDLAVHRLQVHLLDLDST